MKRQMDHSVHWQTGFTLVELLTVMAIIGILAALLLTTIPAAINATKVKQARMQIARIATAITGYEEDYGRFPVSQTEQSDASTNDLTVGLVNGFGPGAGANGYAFDSNSNVVAILTDLQSFPNGDKTVNNDHVKNTKRVNYLKPKMSGYDPASNNPNPPGGVDNTGIYRDPWGNPYIISMDLNHDQRCSDLLYSLQSVSQNPPHSSHQTGYNGLFNPVDTNGQGNHFYFHGDFMIWSTGPDKKYDAGPANSGFNKDNILSWH